MEKSRSVNDQPSSIDRLTSIIKRLRGDNGCPWDREQTPRSLMVYLAEEVYELVSAIEEGESGQVCEELGDVLFLVLFIADIYDSMGAFTLAEVVTMSAEKMIRRHPHIFGDKEAKTADDVKRRWQQIKQQEKQGREPVSIMDTVPRGMPALLRAYRLTARAAGVGFDWKDVSGVLDKVKEEVAELEEAISAADSSKTGEEFGDLLFTLVNLARFLKIHPETALTETINKFVTRFQYMEAMLARDHKTVEGSDFDTLNSLWEEAKQASG